MIDQALNDAVFSDIDTVKANTGFTGASLHAATMGHDSGDIYIVTGPGIHRQYSSAGAAYASYRGAWKSKSIWKVLPDGKRKLVLR